MANANSRVLEFLGNLVTQDFKGSSVHSGIDIVGSGGTADYITAHSPGTVDSIQTGYSQNIGATDNASYGNMVKIKHSNGYYTLYAHLASVNVAKGAAVTKGQRIGYMGKSGNASGVHLHFEVRTKSDLSYVIDPYNYLNADLPNLNTSVDIQSLMSQYQSELGAKAASSWASTAVTYCKNKNISDGTRPQGYVTREEMMQLITNFHYNK